MADRWTLAYRRPRANYFRRVNNWEGTWAQALELAEIFSIAHPEFEVYYVPTRETEQDGSCPEDRGNILVDTGRRISIRETGTLSGEMIAKAPDAAGARRRFEAQAH
jgi:hypothetical protein